MVRILCLFVVLVRVLLVIVTALFCLNTFCSYALFICVVIVLPFRDAPPLLVCVVVFVCLCWPRLPLSFCSCNWCCCCLCVDFDVFDGLLFLVLFVCAELFFVVSHLMFVFARVR